MADTNVTPEAIGIGLASIAAAAVYLRKLFTGWKSTGAENSVITLMREELERMSQQNTALQTELNKLQREVMALNTELVNLTAENQRLHQEITSLTTEVTRLQLLLNSSNKN
jgi:peptidoglycan hydrolase CwlO-like protein